VAYRINRVTGREEIQANGAWYPVEYEKVLLFSSLDGGYHARRGNAVGSPDFRCIVLPGMASLFRSKAFAWTIPYRPFPLEGAAGSLVAQTLRRRAGSEYFNSRSGHRRPNHGHRPGMLA
jgi:hypothetical protein